MHTNHTLKLHMDPDSYDQSKNGWRSLPIKHQVKSLTTYLNTHAKNKTEWKDSAPKHPTGETISPNFLRWHLGQVHAVMGHTAKALESMHQSSNTPDKQWNKYAKATMAFLRKDRHSFDIYASGVNYNKETLYRLRRKWNKPYRLAY